MSANFAVLKACKFIKVLYKTSEITLKVFKISVFSEINKFILKQKLLQLIKFLAFFAFGILLFWLVYKDQDVERIKSILKNDVEYLWIWIAIVLGILSHISRTLRWALMIEPLGRKPRVFNTFLAVMVGYLMNLVLPRMGEISRCGVLSRYENISFTKLVGTVVTERIIDVIMLLLLALLAVITQFGEVLEFFENNPDIREKLGSTGLIIWILLIAGALMTGIFFFRRKIKKSVFFGKLNGILSKFGEGLRTIKDMKNKGAFIFHTLFIWLMYFLMLYVVFLSFEFTSHLTVIAGLTVFVLSSFGMAAPVQGGIGAWHFMVMQALLVYGVAKTDGVIFAFLAHGTMTAMQILLGVISLLILPFINRRTN